MAGSKPEYRMQILDKLEEMRFVEADTLDELKSCLGMSDVCNTQFSKALRSLCYHYGAIRIKRPHAWARHYGPLVYKVTYVSRRAHDAAMATIAVAV